MSETKNQLVRDLEPIIVRQFGSTKGQLIMEKFWPEFNALCEDHADESKAVRQHTHQNIYPIIAFYRVLQDIGLSREEANRFLYDAFAERAEKMAKLIRRILILPGLYKLMPAIWKKGVAMLFGPEAGFEATHYPTGKDRIRFDMTRCPYFLICQREGCPELTPIFCNSDDVCYGNMHPKLRWNRTKTIGRGGDCCDFDLKVVDTVKDGE